MRIRKAVTLLAVLSLTASQACASTPNWMSGPGTIPYLKAHPELVGQQVTLSAEMCVDVGSDYLIVREPVGSGDMLLVAVGADARQCQSVQISGTLMESADHGLYIGNARVYAYSQSGKIIYWPLPKPWPDILQYCQLVDITLSPGRSPINGPGLDSSTPESGGELYSLTQGTIPWARSLADGTSTETLSGKLLSASFGTYFYIQEPGMPLGIRVGAAPPNVPLGELLSIVGGTMGTVNGERVIQSPTSSSISTTARRLRTAPATQA